MEQGPVVSELGRRWVRGELSSRTYFAKVRAENLERARREVGARLRSRLDGAESTGLMRGWLSALLGDPASR